MHAFNILNLEFEIKLFYHDDYKISFYTYGKKSYNVLRLIFVCFFFQVSFPDIYSIMDSDEENLNTNEAVEVIELNPNNQEGMNHLLNMLLFQKINLLNSLNSF